MTVTAITTNSVTPLNPNPTPVFGLRDFWSSTVLTTQTCKSDGSSPSATGVPVVLYSSSNRGNPSGYIATFRVMALGANTSASSLLVFVQYPDQPSPTWLPIGSLVLPASSVNGDQTISGYPLDVGVLQKTFNPASGDASRLALPLPADPFALGVALGIAVQAGYHVYLVGMERA